MGIRWQRLVLCGGLILLVLLIGASWVAHTLLDPAHLAKAAQQRSESGLQRKLALRGLELSLYPTPRLSAEYVALANPPWAQQPWLFEARDLQAKLDLRALLGRKLVLRDLSASELLLNMETDKDGRHSWTLPNQREPGVDFSQLKSLQVQSLRLQWQSPASHARHYALEDLKLEQQSGHREVQLQARLVGALAPLQLQARAADLSHLGQEGAASEGEVKLGWASSQLSLAGRFPLQAALANYDLRLALKANTLAPLAQWLGIEPRLPPAPIEVQASLAGSGREHRLDAALLRLGKQEGQTRLVLNLSQPRARLTGSFKAERLDWREALRDLGVPAPPKKPAEELLPVHALPWPALNQLQAIDAELDTAIAQLIPAGSLEFRQWQSHLKIDATGLRFEDARFQVLGGNARGQLQLQPARRGMALELEIDRLLLEDWFRWRGKTGLVSQGPTSIKANLKGSGNSWKEIAASIDGPVDMNIGALQVKSKKAQEAQAMLVGLAPAFSGKNEEDVRLACLAVHLPFRRGQASTSQLAGVRSDVSKLLLGGAVDLRSQRLDLRGRVRASSGATLGMASLAGDVRIAGALAAPQVSLDPPGTLARVGAAIATTGLSVVATAIYDAVTSDEDPCALVSQHASAKPVARPRAAHPASTQRRSTQPVTP